MTSKFPVPWAQVVWRGVAMWLLRLSLCGLGPAVWAGVAPLADAPIPTLTAQSDEFELVGRLTPDGMQLWLDDAPSNRPVLKAQLTLELAERAGSDSKPLSVTAEFRSASADYAIAPNPANAAFLAAVRQPGHHALNITLLADNASDLLAGDLVVDSPATPDLADSVPGWRWALGAVVLLAVFVLGRRSARGGAR